MTYENRTRLAITSILILFSGLLAPAVAQEGHAHGAKAEGEHAGCPMMRDSAGEKGGMECPHRNADGAKHGEGRTGRGHRKGQGEHGRRGGDHRALMGNIHGLMDNHRSIHRAVENIEYGIIAVTTTDEPELVETLQTHVGQMVALVENGGSIRHWDPLFVEIFNHADKIVVKTELLEDGVRVTETSDDPYVVKLIQAHAQKVNEFVARGMDAMHEPTAVPEP